MLAGSVAVKVTEPSPPGAGAGNSSLEQDVHRANAPMAAIASLIFFILVLIYD